MIDTHASVAGGDGAGSVQGSIMAFGLGTLRRGVHVLSPLDSNPGWAYLRPELELAACNCPRVGPVRGLSSSID